VILLNGGDEGSAFPNPDGTGVLAVCDSRPMCIRVRHLARQLAMTGQATIILFSVLTMLWPRAACAQATNEEDFRHYSLAAAEAMERQDYAAAEGAYQALLALSPNLAEARSNLGVALYLQKKYEPASEQFQLALKLKSSLFVPNFFLARIYSRQWRFREALPLAQRARQLQPQNNEACRLSGAVYTGLGEFRRGIEVYQSCLEKEPGDLETAGDLGAIYTNLARQTFDRLSTLPQTAFSSVIKGNHYFTQNEWNPSTETAKAARVEYRRALAVAPQLPEIRFQLGTLDLLEERWDEAARLFQEELALDPMSYLAHFGLAEVAFNMGNLEGSIQQLKEVARIRPVLLEGDQEFFIRRTKDSLTQLLAELSSQKFAEVLASTYLRAVVARELADSGQERLAREEMKKAINERSSKRPVEVTDRPNEDIVQNGLELLSAKQYEEGTQLLLPLSRSSNADPSLQLEVAKALFAMKNYEDAAQLLESVVQGRSRDPEPVYWLALSYQKSAEARLRYMVAIDPNSYRVHWLMGDLQFELERYEPAVKEYKAALGLRPDNSQLYLNLGNVYREQMKYAEARECYRKSIQIDPYYAPAHLMLGEALLTESKGEEAVSHLRTAVKLNPSVPGGHAKLAKALASLNQFEEAVRELEVATAEDKDGALFYQLSSYYRKLGQTEKATAALQKSQELKELNLKQQQLRTMGEVPDKKELSR
jgi:tetratricopeptide (TPR) repeat protein